MYFYTVLHVLNDLCYIIYFWHLSCFVFSEFCRSVVLRLTLIWRNSQNILKLIFFKYFFSLHLQCSHYVYMLTYFLVDPQFLDILVYVSPPPNLSLPHHHLSSFHFVSFYWYIVKLWSFLIHVQSTNESIKGILISVMVVLVSSISFFWPDHMASWILVPQPGIEPVLPALGSQSLNPWTAREFPPAELSKFSFRVPSPL